MLPIMAPPSVPFAMLHENSLKNGATDWYAYALVALWDAGIATGVDPLVLAAQCAHETAWGKFGGRIDATWGNTCGLKHQYATGDKPEDHARFPYHGVFPVLGALAHAQHLRAYCGFPLAAPVVDPRAGYLTLHEVGDVMHVEDLSNRWAPSANYGAAVVTVASRLRGAVIR